MNNFNVSYDITTQLSAEAADVAEYGYIGAGLSLRGALEMIRETRTNQVGGVESIEPDSVPTSRPRWITITNAPEYQTGAVERRSLCIPDSVTDASARRIARLLGVKSNWLLIPISDVLRPL